MLTNRNIDTLLVTFNAGDGNQLVVQATLGSKRKRWYAAVSRVMQLAINSCAAKALSQSLRCLMLVQESLTRRGRTHHPCRQHWKIVAV